jgi:hypothetical protein
MQVERIDIFTNKSMTTTVLVGLVMVKGVPNNWRLWNHVTITIKDKCMSYGSVTLFNDNAHFLLPNNQEISLSLWCWYLFQH